MDIEKRKQFYLNHFEKQKSSGLTIKNYCKENGISDSSFYSWRKRLSKDHNLSLSLERKNYNLSSNSVMNSLENDKTEQNFIEELIQNKNLLYKKYVFTISFIAFINIICLIVGMSAFIVLLIIGSYLGATLIYLYRNDSISKAMKIESDEL